MQLVERAVEVEPVSGRGVQRSLDEDGDRSAEQDRHHREVRAHGEALARRPRAVRGFGGGAEPERGPLATLDTCGDAEQDGHGRELHERQRRGQREVQELSSLPVDLGFERREPGTAEYEDDAE